jgi:LacI family transcriptional regulator
MGKKSTPARPLLFLATALHLTAIEPLVVLKGLQAVCRERGWILRQIGSGDLLPAVKDFSPDAVIFVLDEAFSIPPKALRGQVVVSAGHDLLSRGWPSVTPDDAEIGRQAARHLLDRGLRSLAAFGAWHDRAGKVMHPWAVRRADGFAEGASSAGIAIRRLCDSLGPPTGRKDHDCFSPANLRQWLTELPKPVGILAACDGWGGHLSVLCKELGLRVPEDVAIIGVGDGLAICETSDPPLSSVTIPWERLGRLAAELAGEAVVGRRLPNGPVMVPPAGITTRRSSDTLAIDEPDVAAALSIILAHADRPLTVGQILQKVPTTQRWLERHFKKLIGRRMVDEIRRVHIERAKQLLADSKLSMPEIARRSGFKSSPGLSVAFRRETGTTPSKFRRRHRS